MSDSGTRSGYVAIVGRPNAGKSTLLNALIGQKISITSRRPQTTRQNIAGIVTRGQVQLVFLDTPGFQTAYRSGLTRAMDRGFRHALADAQVVMWLIDASAREVRDDALFEHLRGAAAVVIALNKIDKITNKNKILTLIESLHAAYHPAAIVPICAQHRQHLDTLLDALQPLLPAQAFLFASEEITTSSVRSIAAEMVREKLFRLLGQELPYSTAVDIDAFEEKPELTRISAVILVDKPGQKAIVIGKGGEKLKTIGSAARKEIEALVGTKVFLQLFVKVKQSWADDQRVLHRLGLP
ncbi:MAG: GTPase Era [Betaproteobacteria bacterium]|nr:GTPase Era [Betaproteobacteria bacterium]